VWERIETGEDEETLAMAKSDFVGRESVNIATPIGRNTIAKVDLKSLTFQQKKPPILKVSRSPERLHSNPPE
jgi:hypothetical protein